MASRVRFLPDLRIGTLGGFSVWAVDGERIRNVHDVDFTTGGNPERYPTYVPEGRLWIEQLLRPSDAAPVILHEYLETLLMQRGLSYGKAHDRANVFERRARAEDERPRSRIEALRIARRWARAWAPALVG